MARQKYLWNPLMDYWFRMEIEGREKLPEPPALLIGSYFRRMGVLPAAPDSMPVLARGRRLASALQLDKVARLTIFPIALSAPWGIAPAMLPELPLPTKIRTAFQEPVEVDSDPERGGDDAYVDEKYEEVRRSIQGGMDALARLRAFPVFG